MWCSHCQHEVPGLVSLEATAEQRCPKCKRKLTAERPAPAAASRKENAVLSLALAGMPVELDDWELEDDLRATKRILALVRAGGAVKPPAISDRPMPPIPEPRSTRPLPTSVPPSPRRRETAPTPASQAEPVTKNSLAWMVLSLGLMAFVCGGVLVAWSFAANRPDLWKLGLPITLAGQAGLIIGLVLQLDGLWHSTRRTTETLDELDDELAELKHATTMLGASHSSPAQSFFAHYSGGASPQLLLADLKGQLDLLASRLADEQRAA